MQGEIDAVLNSICPDDQSWRIESLELDLGKIELQDLEAGLSERIRTELREQLINLFVQGKRDQRNFKVIDKSASQEEVLVRFFLHGVMPWSHSSSAGSMNKILEYQLKHNAEHITPKLKEVGRTHERVRKRMAWQINELNMNQLIRNLEPNNYTQIEHLSKQFITLQKKKTILQSSTTDFKKNLWFWILNHLLTERGTLFNKKAFIKSSIRQMANQYKIGFEEFLNMIQTVIQEVSARVHIDMEFITILRSIADEDFSFSTTTEVNHWDRLVTLLEKSSGNLSSNEKVELNELIRVLPSQNASKFKQLFCSVFAKQQSDKLMTQLNEFSINAIVSSQASKTIYIREITRLIAALARNLKIKDTKTLLNQSALEYALFDTGKAESQESFLDFCISRISDHLNLSPSKVAQELLKVESQASLKNPQSLEIYTQLQGILSESILSKKATVQQGDWHTLFDEFYLCIKENGSQNNTVYSLQRFLQERISMTPTTALSGLRSYTEVEKLKTIIPFLFNDTIISKLVKNSPTEIVQLVTELKMILKRLSTDKEVGSLAQKFHKQVEKLTLNSVLLQGELKPTAIWIHVLRDIESQLDQQSSKQFTLLLTLIEQKEQGLLQQITRSQFKEIIQKLSSYQSMSAMEKVEFLTQLPHQEENISTILKHHFSNHDFTQLHSLKAPVRKKIMNYLIKGGDHLLSTLIRDVIPQFDGEISPAKRNAIEARLTQVFWSCLLNRNAHKGIHKMLARQFHLDASNFYSEIQSEVPEALVSFSGKARGVNIQDVLKLVQQTIESNTSSIEHEGVSLGLDELLKQGCMMDAKKVRKLLATKSSSRQREFITDQFSVEVFSTNVFHDLKGVKKDTITILRLLINVSKSTGQSNLVNRITKTSWEIIWKILESPTWNLSSMQKVISEMLTLLVKTSTVDISQFATEMKRMNFLVDKASEELLHEHIPGLTAQIYLGLSQNETPVLKEFRTTGKLEDLCYSLIILRQIPAWLGNHEKYSISDLLSEVHKRYPTYVLKTLQKEVLSEQQRSAFFEQLSFEDLCKGITSINTNKEPLISLMMQLYVLLEHISFAGISSGKVQEVLYQKVLIAWTSDNWNIISPDMIWNELIWEVSTKHRVAKDSFIQTILSAPVQFPPTLQVALSSFENKNKPLSVTPALSDQMLNTLSKETSKDPVYMTTKITEAMPVNNAGIVVLNTYYKMLFDRLNLLSDGQFESTEKQHAAIHYLQYVVTGLTTTEESYLTLNKLLCGVPIKDPVPLSIELSEDDKQLIDGLIKAAIGHWTSIGDTSINGFRGNWLVRDGMLSEQEDRWELVVEKRPYDILMNQSPFSFSIIRYPWMEKPLHVTWPY